MQDSTNESPPSTYATLLPCDPQNRLRGQGGGDPSQHHTRGGEGGLFCPRCQRTWPDIMTELYYIIIRRGDYLVVEFMTVKAGNTGLDRSLFLHSVASNVCLTEAYNHCRFSTTYINILHVCYLASHRVELFSSLADMFTVLRDSGFLRKELTGISEFIPT